MSDTSQGDGWWLASDGKWYPPEATPGTDPVPPPPPPLAPPNPVPTSGTPVWRRPWFVVIAILVVGLLIAGSLSRDDDEGDADRPLTSTFGTGTDDGSSVDSGDTSGLDTFGSSESGDFVRCAFNDEDGLELEVVNTSSETSNYFITIVFRDADGARLADERQSVDNLRPGERTIENSFSFERVGTSCEAGDVDRFSAQSAADELDDANGCEVTGRDSFDDLAAATGVTNNSSETSDYFVTVAFVNDDGVRVGTGTASVSAVAPGETAPGDVFTFVDDEAGVCEVVAVQRFANN